MIEDLQKEERAHEFLNLEEKMKEENKGKETNKVILKRPRSDTVADFNLSALETGSGFKKKQHK